jgi:hypothetical protein
MAVWPGLRGKGWWSSRQLLVLLIVSELVALPHCLIHSRNQSVYVSLCFVCTVLMASTPLFPLAPLSVTICLFSFRPFRQAATVLFPCASLGRVMSSLPLDFPLLYHLSLIISLSFPFHTSTTISQNKHSHSMMKKSMLCECVCVALHPSFSCLTVWLTWTERGSDSLWQCHAPRLSSFSVPDDVIVLSYH